MNRVMKSRFLRSVAASVCGAALFAPVDSVPWWMPWLRDLPFPGWLWPLLAAVVAATFVYRMGAEYPARGEGTASASGREPEGTASASGREPELDRRSREPVDLDLLVKAVLSLKDATPVEVELQRDAYNGQHVTVSGTLGDVHEETWADVTTAELELDPAHTANEFIMCHLNFPLALAPAIKALAKGIHLRASGMVRNVRPRAMELVDCELLRIGGDVSSKQRH